MGISMLGMKVCEQCHEKDRIMTKCTLKLLDHHFLSSNSECQICGKKAFVCHCTKYTRRYSTDRWGNDLKENKHVRMSNLS